MVRGHDHAATHCRRAVRTQISAENIEKRTADALSQGASALPVFVMVLDWLTRSMPRASGRTSLDRREARARWAADMARCRQCRWNSQAPPAAGGHTQPRR